MTYSIVSLLLAVVATWAILSPDVDDGIVIKFGLCLIAVGAFGGASVIVIPTMAARIMILCGVVICVTWAAYRAYRRYQHETHTTAPGEQ